MKFYGNRPRQKILSIKICAEHDVIIKLCSDCKTWFGIYPGICPRHTFIVNICQTYQLGYTDDEREKKQIEILELCKSLAMGDEAIELHAASTNGEREEFADRVSQRILRVLNEHV